MLMYVLHVMDGHHFIDGHHCIDGFLLGISQIKTENTGIVFGTLPFVRIQRRRIEDGDEELEMKN